MHQYNMDITIRELGRIRDSNIKIKPLTLFMGENNSGKSYLATVAWALNRIPVYDWYETLSSLFEDNGPFKNFFDFVSSDTDAEKIPSNIIKEIEIFFKKTFNENVSGLVQKAFNNQIGNVDIDIKLPSRENLVWEFQKRENHISVVSNDIGYGIDNSILKKNPDFINFLIASAIGLHFEGYLPPRQDLTTPQFGSIFIPASRTGYVHLFPLFLDKLITDASPFSANKGNFEYFTSFTAPQVHFLRMLALTKADNYYSDITNFLKEEILKGSVEEQGSGQFRYKPNSSDKDLPITLSSAMISEVFPLIWAIERMGMFCPLFVYEEPESHLHPRLQRIVASALVRLVNRGVRVLVTTHSDTFTQQISNFIKLGSIVKDSENKDEFLSELARGTNQRTYKLGETLIPEYVGAYEFQVDSSGYSRVIEREVNENGISVPSFNNIIDEQVNEVIFLNDELEQVKLNEKH